MWKLWVFTFSLDWIQFVKGVEFYRCVENHWFLSYFEGKLKGKKCLDVGPWKSPLPTFCSKELGTEQSVVDIFDGVQKQLQYALITKCPINAYVMKMFDSSEKIKFSEIPSKSMDIITCISTIEHFSEDGDVQVMAEIYRILKTGGQVFLTVPYGQTYSQHVHHIWQEKTYDLPHIKDRLQGEMFFRIDKEFFFKDSRTLWFTKLYWSLPRFIRFALGRFWIVPASYYIRTDKATSSNASLYGFVGTKLF